MASSRSLNVVITADSKGFARAAANVDRDADKLQKRFNLVASSADGLSARFTATAGSLGSLVPMLASATPALAALGTAAAGVGASFASAAAGAGALGVGFGASMAPILVVGKQVTSRFEEIQNAYKALQKAQQDHTDASKKAADQALSGLSKNEQAMARSLGALSGLQQKVLGGASDRIFGALAEAIPKVAPALEKLAGPFTRLGDAIGKSIGRIASDLTGGPWSRALKSFVDSATTLIRPMTTVFLSIGNIMRDIATASLPMLQDGFKGVAHWFADLDQKATRSKIRGIVEGLVSQTKSWLALFGQLAGLGARVFEAVFGGGAKKGQNFIDTLTNVVRSLNHFIDGMKAGSGAGGQFASNVSNAFKRVQTVVQQVVTAVKGWLERHREDIHSVIEAFKNVAVFARDTWQQTLLPTIRNAVRAIGPILQGLGSTIRGLVRLVSGLLSGDWDKAWSGAKEAVRGAFKAISTFILTSGENLIKEMSTLGTKMVQGVLSGLANLGKALAQGILDGVKYAASHVTGAIGSMLSGVGKSILHGVVPGGDGIGKAIGDGAGFSLPNIGGFPASGLDGAHANLGPFASLGSSMGLHVTAGRNHHSTYTSSGNISYHSLGDAIDEAGPFPAMRRYASTLFGRFGGALRELISPWPELGIKDGQPFRYSPSIQAQHSGANAHVHVAYTGDGHGVGDGIGFTGLERLWVQAGGSQGLAPLMAHIAEAESGGNPNAYNPSGATGLWQILGNPFAGNARDPLTNAKMAVWKYQHQGLGAWAASRGTWGRYVNDGETYSGGSSSSGSSKAKAKTYKPGVSNEPVPAFHVTPSAPSDPSSLLVPRAPRTVGGITGALGPAKGGRPIKGYLPGDLIPEPAQSDKPGEYDYLDLALAQAESTSGSEDDLAALGNIRAFRQRQLASAQAGGDPRVIAQAIRDLKGVQDSIDSLTDAINQNNAIQQQRDANEAEILSNQGKILALANQGPEILAAVIAAVNGGIGGKLGLGFQTPGYAGGVASYGGGAGRL